MKKVYLSLFAAGIAFAGFSQKSATSQLAAKSFASELKGATGTVSHEKAAGDTVWYDDFSTPSNWTIGNDGQSGTGFGWIIGTTSESWAFSSTINSTSGGNFAEVNNGDPTSTTPTQAIGVAYTLTTTNPISLTGVTHSLMLNFQQYGAHFYDAQEVYISEDGTNWTLVGNNNNIEMLTSTGGSAYTNPTTKSINLSGAISSSATQLYLRFSWTSEYPSETTANVWVTYGWEIDDVAIIEANDDDLEVMEVFTHDIYNAYDYYNTPDEQTISSVIGVYVHNNGGVSQTKTLDISISDGSTTVYTGTTPSFTLAPGAEDTIWFDTQTTLSNIATYTVTATLPSDDLNTNNSGSGVWAVTDYIYGQAFPTLDQTFGFNSSITATVGLGNIYHINADQLLKAVDVQFASGTSTETYMYIKVYEMPSGNIQGSDVNMVAQIDLTTPTTINTSSVSTYELDNPYTMQAGMTYMVLLFVSQSSTEKFVLKSSSQGDEDNSTVGYGPFGTGSAVNFYTGWGEAPVVNLNFNPVLAINEVNSNVAISNVYPNPTTGTATISYSLENAADAMTVNVVDVAGRIVYTTTQNNIEAGAHELNIDAASFNSGIYYVNMTSAGSTVTQKFVKK